MGNFEDLERIVIETGLCTHCGACTSVCPDYNVGWSSDEHPERVSAKNMCKNCTECYDHCHRVPNQFNYDGVEKMIFGRVRKSEETFGIYRKIITARAIDKDILKRAQDGGITTAIALYLLEQDKVEGIITTRKENHFGSWKPVPMIATTKEDLLNSAGTKYSIAPILQMLKVGVIDQELDRLAMIGLPCQVRSARFLQWKKFELAPALNEMIGLFCTHNYDYEKLITHINHYGLEASEIYKLAIYNSKFHISHNGTDLVLDLRELEGTIPEFCESCVDYSAEYADISIGSQGSDRGWSTVIIRTESAEKQFNELIEQGYIITKEINAGDIIANNSERKISRLSKLSNARHLKIS